MSDCTCLLIHFSFDSDNPEEEGEEHISNDTRATGAGGAETVQDTTIVSGDTQGGPRMAIETIDPMRHIKEEIIKKEQTRKGQTFKGEPVSSGVHTDIHNFSLESKRETEYVSTHCSSNNMHFLRQSMYWSGVHSIPNLLVCVSSLLTCL